MKLRISGNSVRLRLLRSEMAALQAGTTLKEEVRLAPGPHGTLRYTLAAAQPQEGAQNVPVQMSFQGGEIAVRLSDDRMNTWSKEDQVGVYERLDFGAEEPLQLVLEKDFACNDGGDVDNSDTFENPFAGEGC